MRFPNFTSKTINKKSHAYDNYLESLETEVGNAESIPAKKKLLALIPDAVSNAAVSRRFGVARRTIKRVRSLKKRTGVLISPKKKKGSRTILANSANKVKEFYLNGTVSSSSSCVSDFAIVMLNGKKVKVQKYFMHCYLEMAHQDYMQANPEHPVSLATFKRLRPKHVIPVDKCSSTNVCLCKKHEDVRLLFLALNLSRYDVIINKFVCNSTDKSCMFRRCARKTSKQFVTT